MHHLRYPFDFDTTGQLSKQTNQSDYVRQLVEIVLFTRLGERVNRPEFGSGLIDLLFEPNSQSLRTTTEMMIQSTLQNYLSDMIVVENLAVSHKDGGQLIVDLTYRMLTGGASDTIHIERAL